MASNLGRFHDCLVIAHMGCAFWRSGGTNRSLDFAATFKAIRAMNYQGWVTIELYPYVDDPDGAARTALTRVREILATGN